MEGDYDRQYDDEPRGYERERSRSPLPERREENGRARSASPARDNSRLAPPSARLPENDDEEAANPGSNLFVTGIHPSLDEEQVSALFEKYGTVEKCNIMRDPHTRDSRGFGFVKMVTPEEADAAKEGLQGMDHHGRTLSIEKARRSRPRTPTPGKYFGPPKRNDFRRGGSGGGGRFGGDRYGDRYGGERYRDRGYEDRGYGGRDDYYRGSRGGGYGGGRDRYDDRGYGSGRRGGDEYRSRDGDRYGPREDRYAREDRRGGGGGGGGYYDRESRGGGSGGAGAPAAAGGDGGYGGRSFEGGADDRYGGRR